MSATPRLLPTKTRSGIAPATEEEEPMRRPAMDREEDSPSALDAADKNGLEGRIRERAYELYVQRGSRDGHAEQDWLDAELDLMSH